MQFNVIINTKHAGEPALAIEARAVFEDADGNTMRRTVRLDLFGDLDDQSYTDSGLVIVNTGGAYLDELADFIQQAREMELLEIGPATFEDESVEDGEGF